MRGLRRFIDAQPDHRGWVGLMRHHPNVLATGRPEALHAFVLSVTPSLRWPIRRISCGGPFVLPPADGTVIFDDIDALSLVQQASLFHWLSSERARRQVISLATTPLYDRVLEGTFSSGLYYRLNLLCFEFP